MECVKVNLADRSYAPAPKRPGRRAAVARHLALHYGESNEPHVDCVRETSGVTSKRVAYVDYLRASVDLLTQSSTVAFDDLLSLHEGLTWLRSEVQGLEETLNEYRNQ